MKIEVFPDMFGKGGVNGFMLKDTLERTAKELEEGPVDARAVKIEMMCACAQRLWNDLQKVMELSRGFENELVQIFCEIVNKNNALCVDDMKSLLKLQGKPEKLNDAAVAHKPMTPTEEIWAKF